MLLRTRAPAKINLTLHVVRRREDGFHDLESLVAFAGVSDALELRPGPSLSLRVLGPTAAAAGALDGNLVLKASRLLAERVRGLKVGAFTLVKRLPVGAGIGGGSSDAAAALRLLGRLNDLSLDDPRLREAARLAGSDVPVCVEPRLRMMRGTGDRLGPRLRCVGLYAVLLNPGVHLEPRAGLGPMGLPPRQTQARLVTEALDALRAMPEARLVRMSGSGSTCFALFADRHAAREACEALRAAHPRWWIRATALG